MDDVLLADAINQYLEVLEAKGWCIIPSALPPSQISALAADLAPTFDATPFCQGAFYGETTKRFGRLLIRSPHAAALVQHRIVQGIAEAVLTPACDRIQLNVAQAISIHPGAPAQVPHRDEDMWLRQDARGESLVNVIWPLVPFHEDNGATRIWSSSHGAHRADPQDEALGRAVSMLPGDALIFLGSTLHAAGANRSRNERRAVVIGYALGWLKPYENPWLAYPPAVARHFAPDLAALVGYCQHRPNLGNFEGVCPSVLLRSDIATHLAATEALRPDQTAAVAAHLAAQSPLH